MYNFLLKSRSIHQLSTFTFLITSIFLYLLLLIVPFHLNGYTNDATPDVAQHLSGWYAFAHESWHFPLLKTNLLNYPVGTTISLTDSIPLFSILFKLLAKLLPPQFNFFSIYLLCNYFFQAFSALTLALSLNRRNYIAVLGFVLFAISAPPLSIFIGLEEGLSCQGLILLALSGYFFVYHHRLKLEGIHLFFGILIIASLLIHPYLTAMIYPFYLLCLFQLNNQNRLPWTRLVFLFVCLHLLILLEFFVFGLAVGTNSSNDFGDQALNLIQPFSGGMFTLSLVRSKIYPGISENVGYLGLGLMFAIIFAITLELSNLKAYLHKYKYLLIIFASFAVISVYGNIWLGTHHLLTLKAPGFFATKDFRTNNRFIWPAWYIAMAFAVAALTKKSHSRAIIFFIPIFLIIQLMDVSNYTMRLRHNLYHDFSPRTYAAPYYVMVYNITTSNQLVSDYTQVNKLIRQSKIIIFYPAPLDNPYAEGLISSHNKVLYILADIQLLAMMQGVPINNAYIAHYYKEKSIDQANDFNSFNPKLLISPADQPSPTIIKLLKIHAEQCQLFNAIYYCLYTSS